MNFALNRFQCLVSIWSFECLQVLEMAQKDEEVENESLKIFKTWKILTEIFFFLLAIIRYLGSRFPETISAVDDDKRSSLHYAATLSDNGHFYNLLVTLGADSKAIDSVRNF